MIATTRPVTGPCAVLIAYPPGRPSRRADSRPVGVHGILFKVSERSKSMTAPALTPRLAQVESQFVDLWGTSSTLWGSNPTMARIHGLLYITGEALTMDDMMDRLGISRGNVSMNLTKLVEWGLVQRAHQRGDRRDRYASVSDVWELFTRVAAQRKRREIDPVRTTLRRCRDALST